MKKRKRKKNINRNHESVPKMFALKKNSKIKSITTIKNIIDQNLYNWFISSLLKDLINCLKDKINPNIMMNFNTLG